MPPKFDPSSPENAPLIALFESLGLAPNSATELVRQPKSRSSFKTFIEDFDLGGHHFDEKQAAGLVKLSSSSGKLGHDKTRYVVSRVEDGSLRSVDQINGMYRLVICIAERLLRIPLMLVSCDQTARA